MDFDIIPLSNLLKGAVVVVVVW